MCFVTSSMKQLRDLLDGYMQRSQNEGLQITKERNLVGNKKSQNFSKINFNTCLAILSPTEV